MSSRIVRRYFAERFQKLFGGRGLRWRMMYPTSASPSPSAVSQQVPDESQLQQPTASCSNATQSETENRQLTAEVQVQPSEVQTAAPVLPSSTAATSTAASSLRYAPAPRTRVLGSRSFCKVRDGRGLGWQISYDAPQSPSSVASCQKTTDDCTAPTTSTTTGGVPDTSQTTGDNCTAPTTSTTTGGVAGSSRTTFVLQSAAFDPSKTAAASMRYAPRTRVLGSRSFCKVRDGLGIGWQIDDAPQSPSFVASCQKTVDECTSLTTLTTAGAVPDMPQTTADNCTSPTTPTTPGGVPDTSYTTADNCSVPTTSTTAGGVAGSPRTTLVLQSAAVDPSKTAAASIRVIKPMKFDCKLPHLPKFRHVDELETTSLLQSAAAKPLTNAAKWIRAQIKTKKFVCKLPHRSKSSSVDEPDTSADEPPRRVPAMVKKYVFRPPDLPESRYIDELYPIFAYRSCPVPDTIPRLPKPVGDCWKPRRDRSQRPCPVTGDLSQTTDDVEAFELQPWPEPVPVDSFGLQPWPQCVE